jgi:predicted dehydrogenase
MVLSGDQGKELYKMAQQQGVILMEANKTAHCPAFNHLVTLIKSGVIGDVVDIEASLSQLLDENGREFDPGQAGGALYEQGSYPLLPIFKLMGINYENLNVYSRMQNGVDIYTRGAFRYPNAICSFKVGLAVKTEGDLIISGTKGYAYVPAPWWKTDYFEVRYENPANNKRYFYQLEGEGIRYEIVSFLKTIQRGTDYHYIDDNVSKAIVEVMQDFVNHKYIVI